MRRRPVIAATLAVVPALGHAYLRRWSRAGAWLALIAGSALVFASLFDVTLPSGAAGLSVSPSALGLGPRVVVPLAVLVALSAVDAYVLARREAAGAGVTLSCPRCGRGVDLSLGFCWYCGVGFEFVREE